MRRGQQLQSDLQRARLHWTLRQAGNILLGCCREAARKASAFAEDGTFIETKEALRLPGFEKAIGFAVQKALEDWRDEALIGGLQPCMMQNENTVVDS